MPLYHGVTYKKYSKQTLNIKRSTDSEFVSARGYVSYTLWTVRFLEAQEYRFIKYIFFQDNMGTIPMEKNGK